MEDDDAKPAGWIKVGNVPAQRRELLEVARKSQRDRTAFAESQIADGVAVLMVNGKTAKQVRQMVDAVIIGCEAAQAMRGG